MSTNRLQAWIFSITVIAALLACSVSVETGNTPEIPLPFGATDTSAPPVAATTAAPPADPWAALTISVIEAFPAPSVPSDSITTRTPQLAGVVDPRVDQFNLEANNLITAEVTQFNADAAGVAGTSPGPSYLENDVDIFYFGSGLVSVRFNFELYLGGAHPIHYTKILNFDVNTGSHLALSQMFTGGADYLTPLSTFCTTELTTSGVLEFAGGTTPVAGNYALWNFSATGLTITFEEYQVASYAVGRQEVEVPYAALAGILDGSGAFAPVLP